MHELHVHKVTRRGLVSMLWWLIVLAHRAWLVSMCITEHVVSAQLGVKGGACITITD